MKYTMSNEMLAFGKKLIINSKGGSFIFDDFELCGFNIETSKPTGYKCCGTKLVPICDKAKINITLQSARFSSKNEEIDFTTLIHDKMSVKDLLHTMYNKI